MNRAGGYLTDKVCATTVGGKGCLRWWARESDKRSDPDIQREIRGGVKKRDGQVQVQGPGSRSVSLSLSLARLFALSPQLPEILAYMPGIDTY